MWSLSKSSVASAFKTVFPSPSHLTTPKTGAVLQNGLSQTCSCIVLQMIASRMDLYSLVIEHAGTFVFSSLKQGQILCSCIGQYPVGQCNAVQLRLSDVQQGPRLQSCSGACAGCLGQPVRWAGRGAARPPRLAAESFRLPWNHTSFRPLHVLDTFKIK